LLTHFEELFKQPIKDLGLLGIQEIQALRKDSMPSKMAKEPPVAKFNLWS